MMHAPFFICLCIYVFLNLFESIEFSDLFASLLSLFLDDILFIDLCIIRSLRPTISGCQLERLPTIHSKTSILDTQKSQDFFENSPCFPLPSVFFCCLGCYFPRVWDPDIYLPVDFLWHSNAS